MKRLFKPTMLAAMTAAMMWLPTQTLAQPGPGGGGGRNFDPEAMRQRMMDGYKEMLDVKSDDEWSVIEPRITKVMEARREIGFGGMGGRMMFGRGRGGNNGGGRRGGFGQEPSAAETELQNAVESKASAETIKTKLAAYREERQKKRANLEKAQEDLKKVLSVRQEAAAVLAGLLE